MTATFFAGNAIKIGILEDVENSLSWGEKKVQLLPARF